MTGSIRAHPAVEALLDVSERLGRDALQVQGPGGNTSFKSGDVMLVKASGTWLAEARRRDIMVPVRHQALRAALAANAPEAENGLAYVLTGDNPSELRPSIETSVHAAIEWPVVLHTHCVATIAIAARADGEQRMRALLGDIDAAFVPYVKPGASLARAIMKNGRSETRVFVLGNHGLVVCGETPQDAEALLRTVSARLARTPAEGLAPDDGLASALEGTGWRPVDDPLIHAVARDPARLAMARGDGDARGALYPDHVIFLGPGVFIAEPGEAQAAALARAAAHAPPQKLALFEGLGAATPADASPSMLALAKCFGDVLARIEPGAELTRLRPEQELELLNWDAEKYRQALERERGRRPE